MEQKLEKTSVALAIVASLFVMLVFGYGITGFAVQTVAYEDLCSSDADCPETSCCLIHQEKGLGVCMEECQSFEFLCTADADCEEGTICCLSEGMEYGLCNTEEQCRSVDLFAEYSAQMSLLDEQQMSTAGPGEMPQVQRPGPMVPRSSLFIATLIIIGLIACIILLVKARPR